MSRNLMRIDCFFCRGEVRLVEHPREITKSDAGVYFDEYYNMAVANAECVTCGAEYLGWVAGGHLSGGAYFDSEGKLSAHDLSFRSTFDDEPGPSDMPKRAVLP